MLELELATTEQILDELSRRPLRFVFVSADGHLGRMQTGYIAHSPDLEPDDTLFLLRKAGEHLEDAYESEAADEAAETDDILAEDRDEDAE